jgi:hypothetical protein
MLLLVGMLLAFACTPVFAQTNIPAEDLRSLSDIIEKMDEKTFAAFNGHDVDLLMSMFTRDVQFYHDKGGLTDYDQTRDGFTKMFGNTSDIRRDLVTGSLKVFPTKDFGAIEIGTHRFWHKENGKDDCGEFPFVMIWKKEGDAWKISRVISYGH